MEHMLLNAQLDFGISYAPYPHPRLDIMEITPIRLGCYYLKNTFEKIPLPDTPFVVPAQNLLNNPLGIQERDGWLESLLPRYKKYSVNRLSMALPLTLEGLCAIHIPDFIAAQINAKCKNQLKLIERALPKMGKVKQTVYLLSLKNHPDQAQVKQLMRLVKNAIR